MDFRPRSIALILIMVIFISCVPVPWITSIIPVSAQGDRQGDLPGTSHDWITIDPLPAMQANESFKISGTGSIPADEYINLHIHLSSSIPNAGATVHNASDISSLLLMSIVNDKKVWYETIDPLEFTPDTCSVDLKVVQYGLYATAVWPSDFPQGSLDDSSSWIRLDPTGSPDLNDNFFVNGTTNLPQGYPLIMEIYPQEFNWENYWQYVEYQPILREELSVRRGEEGRNFFFQPVNLTEAAARSGMRISPGTMYIEVHAVNMNSSVSDSAVFRATTRVPWVKIDPITEPARGTNLTITGTTNLSAGSNIPLQIEVMMHPCFKCSNPASASGSSCCGKCTTGWFSGTVQAKDTDRAERSWKLEVPTENWCWSETYYVSASAGGEEDALRDEKYFHIRET